ncbi:MAG: hypothetical protein OXU23_04915 [Candidatus Poribacteria bacterium]|nr:hypothetical protein [Candidatus Poribacteria bacterium]
MFPISRSQARPLYGNFDANIAAMAFVMQQINAVNSLVNMNNTEPQLEPINLLKLLSSYKRMTIYRKNCDLCTSARNIFNDTTLE